MKIYTGTGDNGMTSLGKSRRVTKTDPRIEFAGTIDELNSHIGLLITMVDDEHDRVFLFNIQTMLFRVGCIFVEGANAEPVERSDVEKLEREIDRLTDALPPQKAFVVPGGCRAASVCHVCRTICRRAERRMLSTAEECEVDTITLAYMNRMSDYLFVFARNLNFISQITEKTYTISCR